MSVCWVDVDEIRFALEWAKVSLQWRRSPWSIYDLTHDQLLGQLQPMIQNARSPELTILRLVLNYSFNVSHLKSLRLPGLISFFTLTNYTGSQQT